MAALQYVKCNKNSGYNLMGQFVNHQNMITVIIILVAVGVEVLVLGDGRQAAVRVAVLYEAGGGLSAAGVVVAVRGGGRHSRRRQRRFVIPLYVVLEYVVGALI